jgi:UDP-N-acetylmuramate--alanine ligase
LIAMFTDHMTTDDLLVMPDPVYFGGTVDRSRGSDFIISGVSAAGKHAAHIPARSDCGDYLVAMAKPGDRIVVMGARDDTLSTFAQELVGRIGA